MKIGEAAKKVDCTPATIRNYVKRYPDFLSESATRQRRKDFTYDDIVILQSIKAHLASGLKYDEIPDRLEYTLGDVTILDTPEQVYDDEPISQDSAIAPIEFFEHIKSLMESQTEQHEKHLQAKDEYISHLKDENTRLREQLEREQLPWWRKIF